MAICRLAAGLRGVVIAGSDTILSGGKGAWVRFNKALATPRKIWVSAALAQQLPTEIALLRSSSSRRPARSGSKRHLEQFTGFQAAQAAKAKKLRRCMGNMALVTDAEKRTMPPPPNKNTHTHTPTPTPTHAY